MLFFFLISSFNLAYRMLLWLCCLTFYLGGGGGGRGVAGKPGLSQGICLGYQANFSPRKTKGLATCKESRGGSCSA